MKWILTLLLLGLLTTACQTTPSVSLDPPSSEATALDREDAATDTEAQGAPDSAAPTTPIKTGTVQAQPSLRIHTSPGTNTPVIYDAPNGTRLDIFAETAMGDSTWYQVSSSLSREIGWAYGGNIIVDGQGELTSDRPPTTPPNPDQGYREGYRLGFRDGENFKRYNSGYNPDGALQAGSGNPDAAYDAAFRRGFYAGFDAGYYGHPFNDDPNASGGSPEPGTDSLSMTCEGSFSNGSRFTVHYTRESGFSRFTLTPTSGDSVTVTLAYSGTTDAQYGVWEGTLGESTVRVDHRSSQAAKPGDELNVTYNIFNGRAVCR